MSSSKYYLFNFRVKNYPDKLILILPDLITQAKLM